MAKASFERTKPHVNVGTIGHIDHGKTTTTASILAVQSRKGLAELKAYSDIAKGGTVRDATKTVTIGSGTQTKTGTVKATLLYADKMECDSCHDVHNTFTVGAAGTGLVKVDPSGSKICLACHNK